MPPSAPTETPLIQERIEQHALDLLTTGPVQAAKREGENALREALPDVDAASLARFEDIAVEITLNALMGFVDGYFGEDLPRLIMKAPRESRGKALPGNRGLHDNPDTYYRLVPLDGESDFVLHGTVGNSPATIFELSALTESWQTIGNLTKQDLGIVPGKRFSIHFGASPGPVADHFIRITPDAEMLLVRETLANWDEEEPCELEIENRVDRGGPRERDDDAYVARAAQRVAKWFRESIRLTEGPLSNPANVFPPPVITNQHGKLVTMAYSISHFHVRPGEALVLDLVPGSAQYVSAPITNVWGTSGDGLARGASWNSEQACMNADGSFTCVLSLEDPGVHNWLDPEGLERGFLFLRWAGLPADRPPERAPGLATRLTTVAALRDELAPETIWLDHEQRRALHAKRERAHQRRFEGPWTRIRSRSIELDEKRMNE